MKTLTSLVRGTEWKQILDLASPSFFEVLPARSLRRATSRLAKAYFDGDGFSEACAARAETLDVAGVGVHLGEPEERGTLTPAERGRRVLELFFHQLYREGVVLLDLRPERFVEGADALGWTPASAFHRFDPAFLHPLREVYAGFYEDDLARFERGLDDLGIRAAEETFLEAFGGGANEPVRFEVSNFTESFHRTFLRCRDAGVDLQADFVPLGLYLATLFRHLEELDEAFDVRAAYLAAQP